MALVKDGRTPSSASASDSAPPASTPAANASSNTTPTPSTNANTLIATTLPAAAPMPATVRIPEPSSIAPVASEPALPDTFFTNNSLAPIHPLLAPPALIKLKTQPRTHSFLDARNTLGFASLGASLTADALSTQKGLAYPGFTEMNPIARPFVQTRLGAAAYNAGSFGLVAGLMYWAHKKEHHKLERILPFAIGGWEGLLSARNYRVVANRAR